MRGRERSPAVIFPLLLLLVLPPLILCTSRAVCLSLITEMLVVPQFVGMCVPEILLLAAKKKTRWRRGVGR